MKWGAVWVEEGPVCPGMCVHTRPQTLATPTRPGPTILWSPDCSFAPCGLLSTRSQKDFPKTSIRPCLSLAPNSPVSSYCTEGKTWGPDAALLTCVLPVCHISAAQALLLFIKSFELVLPQGLCTCSTSRYYHNLIFLVT